MDRAARLLALLFAAAAVALLFCMCYSLLLVLLCYSACVAACSCSCGNVSGCHGSSAAVLPAGGAAAGCGVAAAGPSCRSTSCIQASPVACQGRESALVAGSRPAFVAGSWI